MKSFVYLVSFFVLLTINACAQEEKKAENFNISSIEFSQIVKTDSNIVILDVRTPQELTGEHGQIPGIINIPVQEISQRYTELEKYKDQKIYVICRSGNRSQYGTKFLKEKGFDAVNVVGGMKAYNKLK
jgi:rhodanese-related sulfurtransferase